MNRSSKAMDSNAAFLKASDIVLGRHRQRSFLAEIRQFIRDRLPLDDASFKDLSIDAYRDAVLACQNQMNQHRFVERIVDEIYDDLHVYVGMDRFLVQTNLYLRATRPQVTQSTEAIGWHRETFYGPNMEKAVNVWTPLLGVNELNTLQFVPGSHLVPEAAIVTEQLIDPVTSKGSTGNYLGFLYAPKRIASGVDLQSAVPMNVPEHSSAIFPGNLIHGNAVNRSEQIRFSVDFRVIPHRFYDPALNKQVHAASGKPYFEEYAPKVV